MPQPLLPNFSVEVQRAQSSIRTEILAGLTTFLTCAYIVVVNPSILEATGASFSAVLTATVLVSVISTIGMGLYANNPIFLAPGLGLSPFFTFTMVLGMNIPLETALGAVFWSGILFILMSILKIRELIANSIPRSLQKAISCGIGAFIAFIGLRNAGMVVSSEATLLTAGAFDASTLTFLAGLALTATFVLRRLVGSLVLGIVLTTLLAIPIGRWWGAEPQVIFNGVFAAPDFSLLFALDLAGSLHFAYIPALFTLLFTDLLDSLSTFAGLSEAGRLLDQEGRPLRLRQSLLVDAGATALSGLLGTSPATSFIESAAGIQQGGRTGLTALTAAVLFIPLLFLSPLLSTVPAIATAPPLILVGVFMMAPVSTIAWDEIDEAFPAFLAILLIPLTFSITGGIIWSFLAYALCKTAVGKTRDMSPAFYALCAACLLMLVLQP